MTNFRYLVEHWKQDITTQLATVGVLVLTFLVVNILLLAHQNIESLLNRWGQEVKVNVYLKEDASENVQSEIRSAIAKSDLFSDINFIDKNKAAQKFKDRVGSLVPELLQDIEFDNPLPASFELQLVQGVNSTAVFKELVNFSEKLKKTSGVDNVSYGQGWLENYASVIKVFKYISVLFAFVVLAGAMFVIGNSIRSSLSSRKDEIEILELFGATRKSIIIPYIIEGILLGFLTSLLAVVLMYFLFSWQQSVMEKELSFWFLQTKFEFLNASRIGLILLISTGIGALSAYVWVSKINTGFSAAESILRGKQVS
jgi:cell division transport system permease protein